MAKASKKAATHTATRSRSPGSLGESIEHWRRLKNLTQKQLAEKAGLRQATISKFENGAPLSSLKVLFALCTELNLEVILKERDSDDAAKLSELFK
jgi:HTH-type transcriptional regulator / antitoxin HipB